MTKEIKKEITDLGRFKAVVIGASAGGIDALRKILPRLPKSYPEVSIYSSGKLSDE